MRAEWPYPTIDNVTMPYFSGVGVSGNGKGGGGRCGGADGARGNVPDTVWPPVNLYVQSLFLFTIYTFSHSSPSLWEESDTFKYVKLSKL